MAYTQAHLDALEAALAKGERRVTFGDKTVEYRSIEELQAAIRAVKRDLFEQAVATGLWPGAPRQIRVTTSKGF
ncbi:phage head-tail joining protein [Caldimonas sp.]|uniref:phage head-tail joining protein n=1 Tax=Caldimonas sp. TaxID=2838790 RepID=UPI00391B8495